MKLKWGYDTYVKGKEIGNRRFDFSEYEDRDKAEEECVEKCIKLIEACGATIKDVFLNSIVYEMCGVEFVDVVVLYDEKGFECVEYPRFCSKCGSMIWEGFVDGDDHYCEWCLPYSDEEWGKLYEEYPDYCYWTQWY